MNEIHKSYREQSGHQEDFKVKYKFRSEEEGGRKTLPIQGISEKIKITSTVMSYLFRSV